VRRAVAETRKLAAILVSNVAGYSRLAAADEDRTLARLRTRRSGVFWRFIQPAGCGADRRGGTNWNGGTAVDRREGVS
jgi:hypothetical protein